MKMTSLNELPTEWIKKAKGFKRALELVINEYFLERQRGNMDLELLEPVKLLFFRSAENFMRGYLISKGKSWEDTRQIMGFGSHDLSRLRKECAKQDPKFNSQSIAWIDYAAGSTKNYSGAPYPESGASISQSDLDLLNELEKIVLDPN